MLFHNNCDHSDEDEDDGGEGWSPPVVSSSLTNSRARIPNREGRVEWVQVSREPFRLAPFQVLVVVLWCGPVAEMSALASKASPSRLGGQLPVRPRVPRPSPDRSYRAAHAPTRFFLNHASEAGLWCAADHRCGGESASLRCFVCRAVQTT